MRQEQYPVKCDGKSDLKTNCEVDLFSENVLFPSVTFPVPVLFPFLPSSFCPPFFSLLQFYHRLSPQTLSYCSIITFFFFWTHSGLTPLKCTKFSNMPMLWKHCYARLIRPISCCSATQPSGWIFTMKTNCLFFWPSQVTTPLQRALKSLSWEYIISH